MCFWHVTCNTPHKSHKMNCVLWQNELRFLYFDLHSQAKKSKTLKVHKISSLLLDNRNALNSFLCTFWNMILSNLPAMIKFLCSNTRCMIHLAQYIQKMHNIWKCEHDVTLLLTNNMHMYIARIDQDKFTLYYITRQDKTRWFISLRSVLQDIQVTFT